MYELHKTCKHEKYTSDIIIDNIFMKTVAKTIWDY